MPQTDRRSFLQTALGTGSAWALAAVPEPSHAEPPLQPAPAEIKSHPLETVRVGIVGLGDRGTYLLRMLLGIEKVQVRAVCDLVESKVARAQSLVEERRQPKPEGYGSGQTDYRRLCQREDLDLVLAATPWQLHADVALAALGAGKHVATEVPAALTIDQCWQLVEAAEKAHRHCALLENYCYQRDVMMVWNMVRQGLFGELMHAEGGYQKDARDHELRTGPDGNLDWQGQWRKDRKGNTFPTHDIGPIAQWLGIHRGDRFDYLVSMGGTARALNDYARRYLGPSHALATAAFDMADINVSLVRTVQGRTVYLISDTLLARPQPRNVYRLLGTKGIYDRTIEKLFLEDKSPKRDRWHGDWEPLSKYYEEFEHPWWRDLRNRAIGSGRGAADYLCVWRLIQALLKGTTPDIDVCDAAAWSSVVELTERSARARSQAVDFPDFTRGRWKTNQPLQFAG